ncbi:MAG: hypothetical protein QOF87_4771, partial [Pseudonocardiales bacterium]|nr:hypothetical protein [Pseudonocardiales bacterium]
GVHANSRLGMSLKIICSPRPLGSAEIAATAVTATEVATTAEVAAAPDVGGIRTWVVPGVVARAVPPP